jgi:uncharacterized membrane protein YoaK (UPF0700 family)
METEKFVKITTLLLCFAAGFCDTLTFVAGGEIFSAHVTGNFIVFAYELIKRTDSMGWQRLITFPIFVFAVMLGGWLVKRSAKTYLLLFLESVLLFCAGLLSGICKELTLALIITAMGFQNAFGKLFNEATLGLTTVMTGNVTQAALDLIGADWISLKKQASLIVGFSIGCLAGAVSAKYYGLISAVLPGVLLLGWLSAKVFSDT